MKLREDLDRLGNSLGIGAIIAIVLTSMFVAGLLSLGWYKFFAPRRENIRREVFESTRSYNQGKIQELAKYKHELMLSQSEASKTVLEGIIRHRFAD